MGVTKKIKEDKRFRTSKGLIKENYLDHINLTLGKTLENATSWDKYNALALLVKDQVVEKWLQTQKKYFENPDTKRVYYFSIEFLIGRLLYNNLLNLQIYDDVKKAMQDLNLKLEEIAEIEPDAGLGNGGLGRLAACFLDSIATLGIPGYGYGIRYEYGIFKQIIKDGFQVELPDDWLKNGNPWEIERKDRSVKIKFFGKTESYKDKDGNLRFRWVDTYDILAVPYDTPIIGYGNEVANTLRLWSARPINEFDFDNFQKGNYIKSVESQAIASAISKVLYPNDAFYAGRELRLKQEYFFVSASIQDIIRRFKKQFGNNFDIFPDKNVIQLNDTHPALAIPELMRILVDEEKLSWEKAWKITTKTFAYTNHTVMPEALEKWEVHLLERLLPRHLEILYEINARFLDNANKIFSGNIDKIRNVSIFEEGHVKQVRMANLSIVGSFSINGVSKLHTEILKNSVFKDFYEIWPKKFNNKTNGITQRRWLLQCNPNLSNLINETLGDNWIINLDYLKNLEAYANDKNFLDKFFEVKQHNKKQLSNYIKKELGINVDPESIFDVQVKRLHEYKRQLLNVMHIIYLYQTLKENPNIDIYPRTFIFGAKAAPGYRMAKLIIKLINSVADIVNNDKEINDKIKVVFIPNYNVSLAEIIIPAANVSEQISTAGKEASGTGNMKFALNGALTIGTLDGANIEIKECVGDENIFIFGLTAEQVQKLKESRLYNPYDIYLRNENIRKILDAINNGFFNKENPDLFKDIFQALLFGLNGSQADEYMLLADFDSYKTRHKEIDITYRDKYLWNKKALLNVARVGIFSSDRTIMEYAKDIWNVK
ncbi:maltodextrin phosphorylase [Thermosipho affectus]|uniref:Alpha-1,4 glucan phosphorylase n=1 Tax=Thermosipho affectus TaxID=660294 RepID=A0ABX3ILJ0_9BACT|nr:MULTISPECIES: glycogen/starch/alpha-glucan phosphorylase [Thermosipho]ANQ53013.1 glycosyl transferase family 35 [Thermosipho sp. 1070]APT71460.1 maltodextrin phosphorylase [Thermosipho sp. 1063]ONN28044.1 maltodextrin phosphorylase [Thermosipho affectus]OOC45534.1 maltodextrin phosphorylase [Thermosipho sp. 1074]